jgi:uncharacterized membrane protein
MGFYDMMTGPGAWGMWMLYAAVAGTWIAVVLLAAWALRAAGRLREEREEHVTAVEVLKRRYVEGQMDEAEFQHMRRILSATGAHADGDTTLHVVTQSRASREISDLDWGPRPVA